MAFTFYLYLLPYDYDTHKPFQRRDPPLLAPPDHAGVWHGGAAADERGQRPADRRGWAWLAAGALPGCGRRRPYRPGRLRRGRREQLAAPDRARHQHARRPQDRVGQTAAARF